MKISKIINHNRNDYTADMVCEHCNSHQIDRYGYDDYNYHKNVIPAMHCNVCGKNRSGEKKVVEVTE